MGTVCRSYTTSQTGALSLLVPYLRNYECLTRQKLYPPCILLVFSIYPTYFTPKITKNLLFKNIFPPKSPGGRWILVDQIMLPGVCYLGIMFWVIRFFDLAPAQGVALEISECQNPRGLKWVAGIKKKSALRNAARGSLKAQNHMTQAEHPSQHLPIR